MTQMSFSDAEYNGKRKRTRREAFVAEMEKAVPRGVLRALNRTGAPQGGAWALSVLSKWVLLLFCGRSPERRWR